MRKRLLVLGEHALADHELVALVLGGARDGRPGSAASTALRILDGVGGLEGLARRLVQNRLEQPGLGPAGSSRLRAAIELGRRLAVPVPSRTRSLRSSSEVADWFRCRLADQERESFHTLLLDGKHRPLAHLCVATGSWTQCPLDPKLVLSACLRHGAPAVILVHNHPSGDTRPSRDDLDLTARLLRASRVVGIRVLDHLIVGREGHTSMADEGLL